MARVVNKPKSPKGVKNQAPATTVEPKTDVAYSGFTFSEALTAMKNGRAVARAGWNGKGMFIFMNPGKANKNVETDSHIDGVPEKFFTNDTTAGLTTMPNLRMKSASGRIVNGWLASQTDILAEDWVIVQF